MRLPTPPAPPPPLLTARAVARLLRVDVRTLDRLVAAGGLRRVPWLGGRSRFARADLERLLAEGVPAAPPGRPRRPPAARARRPAPSDAAEIARLPVPTPKP